MQRATDSYRKNRTFITEFIQKVIEKGNVLRDKDDRILLTTDMYKI